MRKEKVVLKIRLTHFTRGLASSECKGREPL